MKKLSYFLSLIVALAIGNQLQAQAGPCQPNYSYQADSTNFVQFTNLTPQNLGFTYRWDFGDNSPISTATNPSHQYSSSGAYGVTLYVDSGTIQCGMHYDTVYVNYCYSYFISNTQQNGTVNFNSYATHSPFGTTYNWDFGDGQSSSQRSPSHTYSNPGTYNVTHSVIDTFNQVICSYTDSVIVVGGSQNCSASYSIVKDTSTTFGVILYNNSSNETSHQYSWDFGDGQSGTGRTPNHLYQNFGSYVVCLTITDSIYNCNITYCDTVGMDTLGNLKSGFRLEVKNPLITSIKEIDKSAFESLSIFPNPANSTVSVDLSDVEQTVHLRLMDLSGKIVLSKMNVQSGMIEQLNIENLNDGFYFLSIESENNRRVEKIVKIK